MYIKTPKDSSAKYCSGKTKKYYLKKATKRYQSLCKEGKEKNNNMIVNDIKISQKIKNKG